MDSPTDKTENKDIQAPLSTAPVINDKSDNHFDTLEQPKSVHIINSETDSQSETSSDTVNEFPKFIIVNYCKIMQHFFKFRTQSMMLKKFSKKSMALNNLCLVQKVCQFFKIN